MRIFSPTYGELGFVRIFPAPPENSQAITPSCDSQHDDGPVAFTRTRLQLDPDPRQIEVLQAKSTIAAAKAVHRAFIHPRSTILIASPTERQSAELARKASEMVAKLGIRPRGNGGLWFMRTPCGKQGGSALPSQPPNAHAFPRFLDAELNAVGPIWFAREFTGEFVDNGMSVCSRDLIERALDDSFGALNL